MERVNPEHGFETRLCVITTIRNIYIDEVLTELNKANILAPALEKGQIPALLFAGDVAVATMLCSRQ